MSGQRSECLRPAPLDRDDEITAAAKRAAAAAPELRPGDDVYEALRPLLAGVLAPRQERGAA